MFRDTYQLYGISEIKQKQQTVLAPKDPSRRELNFGQLVKQTQQICNKPLFHLSLSTIWKEQWCGNLHGQAAKNKFTDTAQDDRATHNKYMDTALLIFLN